MENFAPRGSPHFHSSPSLLPRIDEEDLSFSESDQSYDPIVCAEVLTFIIYLFIATIFSDFIITSLLELKKR